MMGESEINPIAEQALQDPVFVEKYTGATPEVLDRMLFVLKVRMESLSKEQMSKKKREVEKGKIAKEIAYVETLLG